MKKVFLNFLLLIFITPSIIQAQPYYYYSVSEIVDSNSSDFISDIIRINLINPSFTDTLLSDYGEGGAVLADEFQNWIGFDDYNFLELMNINNPSIHDTISFTSQGLKKFNYIKDIDKFLVYYFDSPALESLVLVDPDNIEITDTIPYEVYEMAYDFFVPENGDKVYLFDVDSVSRERRIRFYSLTDKSIAKTIILDTLKVLSNYKNIYDIKNNIALIGFDLEGSEDWGTHYFCFNLNNNYEGSNFYVPYRSSGHLLPSANYYLIEDVPYDSTKGEPEIKTGKISIYKTFTNELIANLSLPPNGEILTFENYPDNFYYFVQSTGESFAFNAESLENGMAEPRSH